MKRLVGANPQGEEQRGCVWPIEHICERRQVLALHCPMAELASGGIEKSNKHHEQDDVEWHPSCGVADILRYIGPTVPGNFTSARKQLSAVERPQIGAPDWQAPGRNPAHRHALGFDDLRKRVVTADLLRGNPALEVENRVVLRLQDMLSSLYGGEDGLTLLDNRTRRIRGLDGGKSLGPRLPEVPDAVECIQKLSCPFRGHLQPAGHLKLQLPPVFLLGL